MACIMRCTHLRCMDCAGTSREDVVIPGRSACAVRCRITSLHSIVPPSLLPRPAKPTSARCQLQRHVHDLLGRARSENSTMKSAARRNARGWPRAARRALHDQCRRYAQPFPELCCNLTLPPCKLQHGTWSDLALSPAEQQVRLARL